MLQTWTLQGGAPTVIYRKLVYSWKNKVLMGFTTGFVNRLVTWVPIFWEERLQQPNIWKFTRGFHRLWSMPILSMGLGGMSPGSKTIAVDMSSASLASSENSDIIALTFLRGPTTARGVAVVLSK